MAILSIKMTPEDGEDNALYHQLFTMLKTVLEKDKIKGGLGVQVLEYTESDTESTFTVQVTNS